MIKSIHIWMLLTTVISSMLELFIPLTLFVTGIALVAAGEPLGAVVALVGIVLQVSVLRLFRALRSRDS